MRLPSFNTAEYEAVSPIISAEQAINVYPEVGSNLSFLGVPGTILAHDFGAPIRGLYQGFGVLYVVAGNRTYSVSRANVPTDLGVVDDDGLPACFAHNIFELLVLSGGNGYVSQRNSAAISRIADSDFPISSACAFLDGYGLLLEKDSGRFRFTDINDFETISGVDFATAESSPDDLVSLLVDHREIWLFGEYSIEVWFNSGDANNPFQRQAVIERGCKGVNSPAKVDNSVLWLGEDNIVYRADQITPVRVSNHGIETLISKTFGDPIAFAYSAGGHSFYELNFPGELTVVYDASTQLWHRRKTRGREDCVYHHHANAYGRDYVGGVNGKLYYLDNDTYTHEGELERIRTFGPLRVEKFTSLRELRCLFETGQNSDAVNPSEVFLEISDDSGRTYGPRIEASVGKQGQYSTEVIFHALGGFYDGERVLKLTMTDDARYTLRDVRADVS